MHDAFPGVIATGMPGPTGRVRAITARARASREGEGLYHRRQGQGNLPGEQSTIHIVKIFHDHIARTNDQQRVSVGFISLVAHRETLFFRAEGKHKSPKAYGRRVVLDNTQ